MAKAWGINEDGGEPAYSAVEVRRIAGMGLYPAVSHRMGARGGVRPHSSDPASVAGSNWVVPPLQAVVYPGITSTSGPYTVEHTGDTGPLNPADGSNPRIDGLDLQVRDDDEDASGERDVRVVYVPGTPAGSPTAPEVTPNALRLATILVPAGGSPSPSIASLAQYTVALGGILPVRDSQTPPATGLYPGAYMDWQGGLWRWSGTVWLAVAAPLSPLRVVYTSGGTFLKSSYPWAGRIEAEVCGGGGGGGGAPTTSGSDIAAAGGGGGGGYASLILPIGDLASSVTVTVGAGGSGATAGANDGSAGSSSSFGAHCSAAGGAQGVAGTAGTSANFVVGGLGGLGSGGDINVQGGDGTAGMRSDSLIVQIGHGGAGAGRWGGGQRRHSTITQSGNGQPGYPYGGGGSGGHNRQNQGTARPGGNGHAGIVVVTVY